MDKRRTKKKREIAKRVKALRDSIGTNQVEFAASLKVARSRVSEWEAGKRVPSPKHFYQLGSLAPKIEDTIWFWDQAGLDEYKLLEAGRKVAGDRAKEGEPLFERREVVLIPRFRQTVEGREEAGPPVPLPAEFIPNPGSTICFVVDGKATAIVDSPKALFILDESEKDAPNLLPFWRQVIFASFKGRGTPDEQRESGIYAGRLILVRPEFRRMLSDGRAATIWLQPLTDMIGERPESLGYWVDKPLKDSLDAFRSAPDPLNNPRVVEPWKESVARARAEIRLDEGWRILGRVLGRLKLEGAHNDSGEDRS